MVMCLVVAYNLHYSTLSNEATVQISLSINLTRLKAFMLSLNIIEVLDLLVSTAYKLL